MAYTGYIYCHAEDNISFDRSLLSLCKPVVLQKFLDICLGLLCCFWLSRLSLWLNDFVTVNCEFDKCFQRCADALKKWVNLLEKIEERATARSFGYTIGCFLTCQIQQMSRARNKMSRRTIPFDIFITYQACSFSWHITGEVIIRSGISDNSCQCQC